MEQRARLMPFLVLSLAAHGAVLWSSHATMSLPTRLADGSSALQVQLVTASVTSKTTRVARARSATVARTNDRPRVPLTPSVSEGTTPKPEVANPEVAAVAVATTHASASDTVAATARVRAAIDKTLANYFFYPERARERGWEGRVLLAFRVQTDGRLDQVRVERSCGYALLDRAAVSALRQVARIDAAVTGLRAALDVHLPVVYRLEN